MAGRVDGTVDLFLRTNRLGPVPRPESAASYPYTPEKRAIVDSAMATHVNVIDGPDTGRSGLETLLAATGTDELMLTTRVHAYPDGRRSFELVAGAWNGAHP